MAEELHWKQRTLEIGWYQIWVQVQIFSNLFQKAMEQVVQISSMPLGWCRQHANLRRNLFILYLKTIPNFCARVGNRVGKAIQAELPRIWYCGLPQQKAQPQRNDLVDVTEHEKGKNFLNFEIKVLLTRKTPSSC